MPTPGYTDEKAETSGGLLKITQTSIAEGEWVSVVPLHCSLHAPPPNFYLLAGEGHESVLSHLAIIVTDHHEGDQPSCRICSANSY